MPESVDPRPVFMNQYQAARVLGLSPRSCRDLFAQRGIMPAKANHGRQRENLYTLDAILKLRDGLRDRRAKPVPQAPATEGCRMAPVTDHLSGPPPAPSGAGATGIATPQPAPTSAAPIPAGPSIEDLFDTIYVAVRGALRDARGGDGA